MIKIILAILITTNIVHFSSILQNQNYTNADNMFDIITITVLDIFNIVFYYNYHIISLSIISLLLSLFVNALYIRNNYLKKISLSSYFLIIINTLFLMLIIF